MPRLPVASTPPCLEPSELDHLRRSAVWPAVPPTESGVVVAFWAVMVLVVVTVGSVMTQSVQRLPGPPVKLAHAGAPEPLTVRTWFCEPMLNLLNVSAADAYKRSPLA